MLQILCQYCASLFPVSCIVTTLHFVFENCASLFLFRCIVTLLIFFRPKFFDFAYSSLYRDYAAFFRPKLCEFVSSSLHWWFYYNCRPFMILIWKLCNKFEKVLSSYFGVVLHFTVLLGNILFWDCVAFYSITWAVANFISFCCVNDIGTSNKLNMNNGLSAIDEVLSYASYW